MPNIERENHSTTNDCPWCHEKLDLVKLASPAIAYYFVTLDTKKKLEWSHDETGENIGDEQFFCPHCGELLSLDEDEIAGFLRGEEECVASIMKATTARMEERVKASAFSTAAGTPSLENDTRSRKDTQSPGTTS